MKTLINQKQDKEMETMKLPALLIIDRKQAEETKKALIILSRYCADMYRYYSNTELTPLDWSSIQCDGNSRVCDYDSDKETLLKALSIVRKYT